MTTARFHLDKPNAKLMGVCAGLSRYLDADVTLIRIATIVMTVFFAGAPLVLLYLLTGWIAADRP